MSSPDRRACAISRVAYCANRTFQGFLATASIPRFLKNQEKVISIVVRPIESWRLPNKSKSTSGSVIAHELVGNAMTFKIFFPRLAGFGWRINYAQQSAGF